MARIAKSVKKGIKTALAILLYAHLGTQATYTIYNIQRAHTSQSRTQFAKTFGPTLIGYDSEIEGRNLSVLTDVMHKEQSGGPFSLDAIAINSENYWEKPIIQQLGQFIVEPYDGFSVGRVVGLAHDFSKDTAHHEVKHRKTFEVLRKHPELLSRWENLAKDENGKSLYRHKGHFFPARIRGLSRFFKDEFHPTSEAETQGFISDYAQENVYEDIAELCAAVEIKPDITNWLYYIENPRMSKKLALAQEYQLIPNDFLDFLGMQKLMQACLGPHGAIDRAPAEVFMKASEAFLRTHPHSSYIGKIHLHRGYIQLNAGNLIDTVEEHKRVLQQPYLDVGDVFSALYRIREGYGRLNERKKEELYSRALDLLTVRMQAHDPTITFRGVNDYLEKNGESVGKAISF